RVEAKVHAQRRGGPRGLGGARRGVAAGARLALRQIDDADAMAGAGRLGQRPTTGQLDVVTMGRDRQKIDVITHTEVPPPDPVSPPARLAQCRTPTRPGSRRRLRSSRGPWARSC